MKATFAAALAALAFQEVSGHATFQDLWINGVDYISLSSIQREPVLTFHTAPNVLDFPYQTAQ